MIKDKFLELAEAQAVTASAPGNRVINRGMPINDNGSRMAPFIVVQTKAAVTSGGASTVVIRIETSVDEAFTSPITVYTSAAIPKANLTANKEVLKFPFPAGTKQFTRAYFDVATGPLTAGTFDIFTVADV